MTAHAINDVARFMSLGGQTVPAFPERDLYFEDIEPFILRMEEEVIETLKAEDTSELVDGFLDTAYVAFTGAIRFAGEEKALEAWEAISKANLSKVDGSLGPIRRNRDGKILKPEGFKHPDIEEVLFPSEGD